MVATILTGASFIEAPVLILWQEVIVLRDLKITNNVRENIYLHS